MKNVNKFLLIFAIVALAGNMATAQVPSSILGEYTGALNVNSSLLGLDETFYDVSMEVKESSPNYALAVAETDLGGGNYIPGYEMDNIIITQAGDKYNLSRNGSISLTIDEIKIPDGIPILGGMTFTNIPVTVTLENGYIQNNVLEVNLKAVATLLFIPVTINIGFNGTLPIPDCDPVTNAKAQIENCETATVTWNAAAGAKEYEITRDGGNPVIVTASPYTEDFEFEHGKSYTWKIKTICEQNEATAVSASATADCESEVCNPVIGETAVIDDCKTATITWNPVAGATGYEVNGEFVEGTEYTEEREFEHGVEYRWEIVTVCESGKSEPVEVKAAGDCEEQSISELANSVSIYPNPTTGELTIDNGELTIENVEIFDLTGKTLNNCQLSTVNCQLKTDISHLPTGVYFVRIQTENGVITKKIIKSEL